MKLLYLTTQLPYPATSGGTIKSFRLVSYLTKHHDITLLCPLKGEDAANVAGFEKAVSNLQVIGIEVNKERSPIGWLKSMMSGMTLNEWRNYDARLEGEVGKLVHQSDLLLVDHYEMFQYIHYDVEVPVILHTHNAEFKLWERFAELSLNPLKKLLIGFESKRILKAEAHACKRSDHIFAAPEDKTSLSQNTLVPIEKFSDTFHLGEDDWLNYPELEFSKTDRSIYFFGTLSWEANLDGLCWFIENVWPKLTDKDPKLMFYVIGKNPPKRLKKLVRSYGRITLTGFVKDLETYFSKCRVFINPVRFGSGIKVKMLEVMYRGVPAVSSRIGVESLDIKHEREVLVASDSKDWVDSIFRLMDDQSTWEKLSRNSREIAKAKYRWEPMLDGHLSQINKLMNKSV